MPFKDTFHHSHSDDGGGGGGGNKKTSCLWFTCGVLIFSFAMVMILATASSSTSAFASAPLKYFPSFLNTNSATSTPSVVENVQKSIIVSVSAASRKHHDYDDHDPGARNSSVLTVPTVTKHRDELKILEKGLTRARSVIRKSSSSAAGSRNSSSTDCIYHNPAEFFQSYREMEKRFKVYVYEEGDPPMVHYGPCKNIYASEGRFIIEMEQGGGGKRFRTRDPHSAHAFFMPFSVTWMVKYIYTPNSFNLYPLREFASDYVRLVSTKHPFWNRTQGADHFMLSCHDWGPHTSKGNPFLYNTSMRVLCNANSSEGFNPKKDVSLPEVNLYDGNVSPKIRNLPPANKKRPFLAFFAGGIHGPVRPILLHHWKARDPDLQVFEYLPKNLDYYGMMLQSRFCLCPSGYEVASPRIVEAIYAECVPVILSDHYVLPFSDVLRYEAFSIKVEVSEIPQLKEVLMGVSMDEYMKLREGLKAVRKHFVLNQPAKRFDMFHMILHSVWLRRLNLKLAKTQ